MNKKILGIIAALAVVVIIVLVAINKPRNSADSEILRHAIEQPADSIATDSVGLQVDTLVL